MLDKNGDIQYKTSDLSDNVQDKKKYDGRKYVYIEITNILDDLVTIIAWKTEFLIYDNF